MDCPPSIVRSTTFERLTTIDAQSAFRLCDHHLHAEPGQVIPDGRPRLTDATKASEVTGLECRLEATVKNSPMQIGKIVFMAAITVTLASCSQTSPASHKECFGLECVDAAENGDVVAQRKVGIMYYDGNSVPSDLDVSKKWLTKAADKGDAISQFYLAEIYAGYGDPMAYRSKFGTSDPSALKWYRAAAESGVARAQTEIGDMYYNGHNVTVNYDEAAKWYRYAAEQGEPDAQEKLGGMYLSGFTGEKNFVSAFFDRIVYGSGTGKKDWVSAYTWYSIAASRGNKDARRHMYQVESGLTSREIAQAQKIASDFVAHTTRGKY